VGEDQAEELIAFVPPLLQALEPRAGPQRGEPHERGHEHRRRRPGEHPPRDRKVLAAHEAVGRRRVRHRGERRDRDGRPGGAEAEPHGATSTDAICCLWFSSSTTNLPSIDAGNVKWTLPPFVTSLCRS